MKTYLCVVLLSLCFGTVSCLLDIDRLTEMFTQGDDMCENCKVFFNDVKHSLKKQTTKTRGIDYADEVVCKELPNKYFLQEGCRVAVEGIVPNLLDLVADQLNAETICTKSTFCSENFKEEFGDILQDVKKQVQKIMKKHNFSI